MRNSYLDMSTFLSVAAALFIVTIAMLWEGNVLAFVNIPSVLIVLFGTMLVTSACFSFKEVITTVPLLCKAIIAAKEDIKEIALVSLEVAEFARKRGILALETAPNLDHDHHLFRKGVALLVDGITPEQAEYVLTMELQAMSDRHIKAISILRKAADIAPAMGLIGTLIGLVQMLGNLSDPAKIGSAMSVALLTTLYGAILSYMVLFPFASKLERNSREELLAATIYQKTIVSIARQENPRQLETVINSLLPPAKRIAFFRT